MKIIENQCNTNWRVENYDDHVAIKVAKNYQLLAFAWDTYGQLCYCMLY